MKAYLLWFLTSNMYLLVALIQKKDLSKDKSFFNDVCPDGKMMLASPMMMHRL